MRPPEAYAWTKDAACAGLDPDMWHRDGNRAFGAARYYCRRCPVLGACLESVLTDEWGLPVHQRHGIWAGMTPSGRMKEEAKRVKLMARKAAA